MSSPLVMIAVPIPRCPDAPPAWYGKIPGAGDFLSRRLPHALTGWWERWLQQGMATLRQHAPDELERHYAVAPLWNFVIPAGAGAHCVQLGCLAPSCDRVGRYYPVMVTLAIATVDYSSRLTEGAGAFYWQVGIALLDAIRHGRAPEQFEQALTKVRLPRIDGFDGFKGFDGFEVLDGADAQADGQPQAPAAVTGWPDLAHYFDPHGATSFWWTNQADGSPLSRCAHTGTPDNGLFAKLFGAQHSREQGRDQ